MDTINERIKQARTKRNLSWQQLGDAVGVTWQSVRSWELEGGTAPTRKRLAAVAAALDVSQEWLLAGSPVTVAANEKYFFIPLYRGERPAGGSGVQHHVSVDVYRNEQPDSVAFRIDFFHSKKIDPAACVVVRMEDDAMAPSFSAGDPLLVDTSDRTIVDNKLYVLQAGDRLPARRLVRKLDGRISVKADNGTEDTMPLDQLTILGRVVSAIPSL